MWRIFLSLIILQYFFITDSKAQLLVGPVAGVGVSKAYFFDHSYYDNYKSSPSFGFDGGIMASLAVHKNYVLNAQLLYSYKSKQINGVSGPGSDPYFNFSSKMSYIELPIFYVLEFKSLSGNPTGRGGKVKTYNWFIGGGPTISYWLSSKSRLYSGNLAENNIEHIDYKAAFEKAPSSNLPFNSNIEYISNANRFQFAINITGGVAFEPVGLHKIVTFVQLNIAQSFFAKSDVVLPTYDIDVLRAKNHSIKISVAYLFDTKIETSKKGKSTKSRDILRRKR